MNELLTGCWRAALSGFMTSLRLRAGSRRLKEAMIGGRERAEIGNDVCKVTCPNAGERAGWQFKIMTWK